MLELGLLYYAAAGQLGAQTHTPTNTWPHALIELQTNELALAAHAHRRQAPVSDVRLTSAARTLHGLWNETFSIGYSTTPRDRVLVLSKF